MYKIITTIFLIQWTVLANAQYQTRVIAFNISGSSQTPDDAAIYRKIDALLKQMTLEEKVGMIHANSSFTSAGVKRLNIPAKSCACAGRISRRYDHGSLQRRYFCRVSLLRYV